MESKPKQIHNSQFSIDDTVFESEDSVLIFDKPYQCTSFDLVAKVKKAIKHKFGKKVKVGHAGTLDPLASGLMIVCTGQMTKKIESYQGAEKEYTGTFLLGSTTPSFDLEKEIDAEFPTEHITAEMIRAAAQQLTGEIEQIPPQFSAVWIAGRRAFHYAREGENVELSPRRIQITEFEITRINLPEVDFRIVCSKGTYIRSIARDFGLLLESGAHLTALRRTRIGNFHVENALNCTPNDERKVFTKKENEYFAMGLMSGTSLDGLDIAFCKFYQRGKKWKYHIIKCETVDYDDEWRKKLQSAPTLSAYELALLHRDFGTFMANSVKNFLTELPERPDFIASHGQTVFHRPDLHLTTQIGSGAEIAALTGIRTICDFRTVDTALGGQGAPLVPIGDELLYNQYDACLNMGGFCNISFTENNKRVAFDIAPCNMLLNYLAQKINLLFDKDGKIAQKGNILPDLLNQLNGLEFYQKAGAKSLGKEWFDSHIIPIIAKDFAMDDLLRTAHEHIAAQIAHIINQHQIQSILVTGGGAKNEFLIDLLQTKIPNSQIVVPDIGTVDFKEAIIFAFLGLLRIKQINNCLRSVTHSTRDNCGGAIYEGY